MVAGQDGCLRLQGTEYLTDVFQVFRTDLICLVQENEVAEFDLLDQQVSDVFLRCRFFRECLSATELILHPQGIDHRCDTVQPAYSVLRIGSSHERDGTEGLCDGFRFTDAAGLDDDVVEAVQLHQFQHLCHQVRLEAAADAAVLEGDQTLVFIAYNAFLADQAGVDVDLSDIVDNHCEPDALLVRQDVVDQGGLSASQITGQQQYRNFFRIHINGFLCK